MQRINWGITINNPTEDEEKQFESLNFKYAVFGREHFGNVPLGWEPTQEQRKRGQVTWTPHLQGMVSCRKKMDFGAIKKQFPRAHIEPCDLNYINYCIKDMDYVEHGDRPVSAQKQGGEKTKKNWELAKQLAIAGKLDEIEASIYVPYIKQLEHIQSMHVPKKENLDELTNEWHWGPTGTGKSKSQRSRYPNAYIKSAATEWWNGYDNQEVVIIEDLDKYHVKMGYYLKIWSDHYPFPANIKNVGERMIRPAKIIITSNYSIGQIWNDDQTVLPLQRRFKEVQYHAVMTEEESIAVGLICYGCHSHPCECEAIQRYNDGLFDLQEEVKEKDCIGDDNYCLSCAQVPCICHM